MLFILFACLIYTGLTVQPQIFTYKTIDNLNIEAGVYVPQVSTEDKFPVVFIIHGGGFLLGDHISNAFSQQELDEMLARGWVVVSIDYRLGPYYLLPDIVEDVVDAYDWVRNDLVNIIPINPDAIAIWGDSAGGGLAVIAGYKTTPRAKAVIAFYPYSTDFTNKSVYNPDTPVDAQLVEDTNALRDQRTKGTSQEDWDIRGPFVERVDEEQKMGWLLTSSDPNESPDKILKTLKEYSVVYHLDADYPPTYLIHGQIDALVPISESTQMADVLRNQNVTYQLDLVPGVDHAFDLVLVSEEIWQQHLIPVFDFMEKYIRKPQFTPIPTPSFGTPLFVFALIAFGFVIFAIFKLVQRFVQFVKSKRAHSFQQGIELVDSNPAI